jgi:hypothetical protein
VAFIGEGRISDGYVSVGVNIHRESVGPSRTLRRQGILAPFVLTSAILTSAERQRLRRAARIMSKSDLSGSGLTGAISDVLGGLPSETV